MKISNELNNSLAVMSDDNVTYFILVYVIRVDKDSITLRFLDPNVKTGLMKEYQIFDIIGDNSLCQKSTGLIFRIYSVEEADNMVDMDEDIRYLNPLTTKDRMMKLNKVKENDDLIYREYDLALDSYSIPERCKIKSVDLDKCIIEFYSYYSKSNKTLDYSDINNGGLTVRYFVKI